MPGLVVVGKIGDDLRMDYTAVGDTPNLAARLQQMARPGSVLVARRRTGRSVASSRPSTWARCRCGGMPRYAPLRCCGRAAVGCALTWRSSAASPLWSDASVS